MLIMNGGIAPVPPDMVDGAATINTVVQRASAALGLAALTSLVTSSRPQFARRPGRARLHGHPMRLGAGPAGEVAGTYMCVSRPRRRPSWKP